MSTERSPDNPIREELVAYLDGELSADECRRIEQQLISDEAYREQLQGLDEVWQALDELPTATVDDAFSRTTMEMVTVAAEEELATQTAALPVRRRKHSVLAASLAVAALVIGFLTMRIAVPDPNRALLADLPLIEHLEVYSEVDDLEFLRRLRSAVATTGMSPTFERLGPDVAQFRQASLESPRERRARVAALPSEQQAALQANRNRFLEQLSRDERARIRSLHESILAAPDAKELQMSLLAYGDWLKERTPGERADLRERSIDERIERIGELAHRDRRRALWELSAADTAALRIEALRLFDEKRPFVEKFMKDRGVDNVDRVLTERRGMMATWFASSALYMDHDGDKTLKRFLNVLSEPVQERMRDMPDEHAAKFVRRWIRHAFRGDVKPADLEQFFVKDLSNARREELLAMPPDQRDEELYQQFVRENFGLRDELGDFERESMGRPDRDERRREGFPPDDEMRQRRGPPPRGDGSPDRDRPKRRPQRPDDRDAPEPI
jgi:hypothetical protein